MYDSKLVKNFSCIYIIKKSRQYDEDYGYQKTFTLVSHYKSKMVIIDRKHV